VAILVLEADPIIFRISRTVVHLKDGSQGPVQTLSSVYVLHTSVFLIGTSNFHVAYILYVNTVQFIFSTYFISARKRFAEFF